MQFGERGNRDIVFLGAELGGGDEAAEILIAGASFGEKWIVPARIVSIFGYGNFGSDMSFDFGLLGGHVEARRTIDSMTIEEGHGREAALGAGGNENFGQGSAFQKTESGAGVEFDVGH